MPTVVGVQFKPVTKVYHFESSEILDLARDDYVIVSTARGQEVAQVVNPPFLLAEDKVVGDMKSVVRRASAWDMVQKDQWEYKQKEALALCRHKARDYNLDIKIVRCEYNFNGGRLLVYFSAESRIDFRALVRELAKIFRTRIEMRQIGVRDEAKLLDGVGKCGRQLCCTSWLREFTPVSIRMAKSQQLPLNPDEISGVCGRLLCCLSYEDTTYRAQNRKMPKLGSEVVTAQGTGRVRHIHPLKESVTVMLENQVMSEFLVSDLISTKNTGGSGGSNCGGCTVKRRASAEADNAKTRRRRQSREGANRSDSKANSEQSEPSAKKEDGGKRRRRRRRPRSTNKPE